MNENNKYDLTISMIVKNEEKYLEECLKALIILRDEISCEIIVTDTGSTDRTVEIAQKFADKVLYFEWCDDFSKARNVGVEASQGKWFMFVDADEIFDKSIIEIAKFIKSPSRDNYDNATFVQRNLRNTSDMDNYGDFNANRLYNFTKEKKYFTNIIHETIKIKTTDKKFIINAHAYHYGYIHSNLKRKRNKPLILEEFKNKPFDIRAVKHLIEVSDYEEQTEYFNYVVKIISENELDNYRKITNIQFWGSVCIIVIKDHIVNNDYDSAIEICKKYFSCNYVKSLKNPNILPSLELYFMHANILLFKGNYKEAVDAFVEYQKIYLSLKKNPDNLHVSFQLYSYDCEKAYKNSFLNCLLCYNILKDTDNLINILNEQKLYKYKENDDYIFLNKYIEYCIKYNQFNLIDEVMKYIKGNENVYSNVKFDIIFYTSLILSHNFNEYIKNCSYDILKSNVFNMFNNIKSFNLDKIYEIIKNKTEYSSLMEMKFYLHLMINFIIKKSSMDLIENYDKNALNEVFELYIESTYLFVNDVYNPSIIDNNQFELLERYQAFGCIVYSALEQKNDNVLDYIKVLKSALSTCPEFKDAVANAIDILQKSLNDKNPVNTNNEFQMLSAKIKLSIIDAIKYNNMEQASIILQQYQTINPNDTDIADLLKLIGN